MTKFSFRKRRRDALETFETSFTAALKKFAAEFVNSDAVKHAASKGEAREEPVKNFLTDHLPKAFGVRKGEAVDVHDNRSPSLDLMIFDAMRNFPFYDAGNTIVLPAEALLASIEVKTLLTSAETKTIFRSAERLYKLRPYKRHLSLRRRDGQPAEGKARFFHCVFAYASDLASDGWLDSEYGRLIRVAKEMGVDPELIQRVYVRNRGLIDLSSGQGTPEVESQGTALMHFFMHLFNFLSRENARREPAPYLEYAGKMKIGWRNLRESSTSVDNGDRG